MEHTVDTATRSRLAIAYADMHEAVSGSNPKKTMEDEWSSVVEPTLVQLGVFSLVTDLVASVADEQIYVPVQEMELMTKKLVSAGLEWGESAVVKKIAEAEQPGSIALIWNEFRRGTSCPWELPSHFAQSLLRGSKKESRFAREQQRWRNMFRNRGVMKKHEVPRAWARTAEANAELWSFEGLLGVVDVYMYLRRYEETLDGLKTTSWTKPVAALQIALHDQVQMFKSKRVAAHDIASVVASVVEVQELPIKSSKRVEGESRDSRNTPTKPTTRKDTKQASSAVVEVINLAEEEVAHFDEEQPHHQQEQEPHEQEPHEVRTMKRSRGEEEPPGSEGASEAAPEEALQGSGFCFLQLNEFPAIYSVFDTWHSFALGKTALEDIASHNDPSSWSKVFGGQDRWMCDCEDPYLVNALHALAALVQTTLGLRPQHMGHLPAYLGRGMKCTEQIWHRDDVASGYSIIVPLCSSYTVDVVPGSHLTAKNDKVDGTQWVKADLEACSKQCNMDFGQILVLDSRVVHRGGAARAKAWLELGGNEAVYNKISHGLSLHIYLRNMERWEWPSQKRFGYLWRANSSLTVTHKLKLNNRRGRSMQKELEQLKTEKNGTTMAEKNAGMALKQMATKRLKVDANANQDLKLLLKFNAMAPGANAPELITKAFLEADKCWCENNGIDFNDPKSQTAFFAAKSYTAMQGDVLLSFYKEETIVAQAIVGVACAENASINLRLVTPPLLLLQFFGVEPTQWKQGIGTLALRMLFQHFEQHYQTAPLLVILPLSLEAVVFYCRALACVTSVTLTKTRTRTNKNSLCDVVRLLAKCTNAQAEELVKVLKKSYPNDQLTSSYDSTLVVGALPR